MSGSPAVDAAPRRADGPLTLATWLCLVAVIPPYLRVVDSGPWTLEIAVLAALILGAGYLARRRRLPAVAVSLLGLVVWVAFITLVFFRETALVWVIPTPDTVEAVGAAFLAASGEIQNSAAPVVAGPAMSFLLVASMGLLAIVIDHVVLSARMPLLAVVGLLAVTLVPPVVVPGDVDIPGFVLLAVAVLVLVRAETRGRHRAGPGARPTAAAGVRTVSGTAIAIGAVAVIVAIVVAPLLPRPTATAFTPGATATISTNLALGDDLRRPRVTQVLLERSSASTPPYLRVATLTRFDGAVWQSDRLPGAPIDEPDALGAVSVNPDILVEDVTTNVEVVNLASPWLPVPYPATGVQGLEGSWVGVPYNRTVVSDDTDSRRQTYSVTTTVPRPTVEQIRALTAGGGDLPEEARTLPDGLPPIIGQLAADVTAGATNDYDRLSALQSWFRGSAFAYSLEAPVEDGFDGSGADAVARFLEVREGYCVHFASSFALMARTLGMPSRVVVGYLPGQLTGDTVDDQPVYSVVSSQLHAWPEVYFDGLGWVAWEPTKSLGVATAFSSTPGETGEVTEDLGPTATPSASARPDTETIAPLETAAPTDAATPGGVAPAPALAVGLAVLVALLVPALVRAVRSMLAVRRARRGDPAAAWSEIVATAIDLGVDVPTSASPRAVGVRLVTAGAPEGAVGVLVAAIENASYAPRRTRVPADVEDDALVEALLAAGDGLRGAAGRLRSARARLAPRSLFVRAQAAQPAPG